MKGQHVMTLEQAKAYAQKQANENQTLYGVFNLNRFNPQYVARELLPIRYSTDLVYETRPEKE